MKGRLLLNVVVRKGPTILELLAGEDEALLVGRDTRGSAQLVQEPMEAVIHCDSPLLVLDLGLDVVNGIRGLDLEGDGLAGEGLHEDLHAIEAG